MERWKINLYIIWFTQIITLMSFNFGIPFLPYYIRELGVTDPEQVKIYTSLLSMATAVSLAIMSPIWGMAADKWGKKLMLMRAMFFASLVVASMGIVTDVNQLLGVRFMQGVFTGTVTAAIALVATATPSNQLSYAIGFLSSSTFIGSSLGPVLGALFADNFGFRVSFYIGGVLMFAAFLLVLLFVKEEKQYPDASISVKYSENKVEKGTRAKFFTTFIVLIFLQVFILRFSRSVFAPYIPLFVEENMSAGFALTATKATGIVNGVTGLMTAIAGITLSRLGDRYNKMKLLKGFFAVALVVSVPLFFSKTLTAFTIIYGALFFILGASEPLVVSMSSEITPPERRGFLFGVQGLVGSLALVISPLMGAYVSVQYSTGAVLIFIPVALAVGLVSILIFKPKQTITGVR